MTKVALRSLPEAFLAGRTVSSSERHVILDDVKFPIAVEAHGLPPRARLSARGGAGGGVLYLWSGSARSGESALAQGSVIALEHGAAADIEAGPSGAQLVELRNRRANFMPQRHGGDVHIIRPDDLDWISHAGDNGRSALYLDSACPGCELWLHARVFRADMLAAPHSHSEDEVMLLLDGSMIFGRRPLSRGAVVSIGNGTIYSFATGRNGAHVINFRPSEPFVSLADGSASRISEAAFYRHRRPPSR